MLLQATRQSAMTSSTDIQNFPCQLTLNYNHERLPAYILNRSQVMRLCSVLDSLKAASVPELKKGTSQVPVSFTHLVVKR